MADGLSIRMLTGHARQELREIQKETDKVTKQTLRLVGAYLAREARKIAPVYAGDDSRAEPGRYRSSIKPSRRFGNPLPHVYTLKVGPRGPKVRLYAPKLEDQYDVMERSQHKAEPVAGAMHEKAWARAVKKR